MTKLILVRHGETAWVDGKIYQGTSDITLSDKGREQAKRIAERLKKEKLNIAYSSKLRRAIQTAKEILRFHKIDLIEKEELNERTYGKWEGLSPEEIEQRYPLDYREYKKDRYKGRPTDGKSLFDLRKRIEPFIKKLIKENQGKTILIVAHNGTLRVMIGILMNYNKEKIVSLYLRPTSVTIIDLDKGKPVIKLINCNKHNE